MKITIGNKCKVYPAPKGTKLDTQMFPECVGTDEDRNVVKKTVDKSKKKKKKKSSGIQDLVEAKKKEFEHSPKEHGFFDECVKKHSDKENPEAYCASIIDKAKGTTMWRGDDEKEKKSFNLARFTKEAKSNMRDQP